MGWKPEPPIEIMLKWPPKNTVDPELRGPEQYIVTGIFGSIALVIITTRLYTRAFVRRYFGIDDWLLLIAFAAAIGVETCITLGKAKYEWDKHLWDWDYSLSKGSLKVLYFARILWGVATCCVRLSILCLYYRLLKRLGAERKHFWILHIVTAFTILFLLDMIIGGAIPCLPVYAYWDYQRMILDGEKFNCINDYKGMQFAAIFNTVSEVVIAILPALAVFRFKVDPRQRWSVIGLLSLGYLVAIAGVVRSYFLWRAAETYDLTWYASPQWCSAEVEIDLAIICACAAPLRAPVERFVRRLRGLPAMVTSSIRGRPSTFGKDGGSILSTTALSANQHDDKFEGVAVIEDEDRNAWINEMSRTIDLEGIAVDGFGYTVTIQGPERPPRRRLSKYTKGAAHQLGSAMPSRNNTVRKQQTSSANRDEDRIELAQPTKSRVVNRSQELTQDEISRVNSEDRANRWNHTRSSSKVSRQESNRVSETSNKDLMHNWTFFETTDSLELGKK